MDRIEQFRSKYLTLSNYAAVPAYWQGEKYPTAEHAFAAAKTLDYLDRVAIREAPTPGAAKKLGRAVRLRDDWNDYRTHAMRLILVTKFAPGTEALDLLLSTKDALLVEGNNWHDQFWGDCHCARHADVPGENQLGQALMQLRGYFNGQP